MDQQFIELFSVERLQDEINDKNRDFRDNLPDWPGLEWIKWINVHHTAS